jgi:hypothetical protein
LVQVGNHLYIVADDENDLAVFPVDSGDHGTLRRLFNNVLPLNKSERKKEKADLEVLTLIPANAKYSNGAMLALGSGSTDKRKRAVIIALGSDHQLTDIVERLDLSVTYNQIDLRVPDLNIEGAVISGDDIVLFQRGNNIGHNAMIRCRADMFLCETQTNIQPLSFFLRRYDLGEIDGVPLGFTDATSLEDGSIVFCAAAEDTSNAYDDGACKGSAVGIINPRGELSKVVTVDKPVKLEGISARFIDNAIHLLTVTDADDLKVPAQIYSAILA